MTAVDGFRPIAEVTADERARIAFGKAGVHKDDRYALAVNDEGALLLTPLASIPKRELLVWENEDPEGVPVPRPGRRRRGQGPASGLAHRG